MGPCPGSAWVATGTNLVDAAASCIPDVDLSEQDCAYLSEHAKKKAATSKTRSEPSQLLQVHLWHC